MGVSAVTVLFSIVSQPVFTGNHCARSPAPTTNTKNAAVTSVAGITHASDNLKNGSERSNSISAPRKKATTPPAVRTPGDGEDTTNKKKHTATPDRARHTHIRD